MSSDAIANALICHSERSGAKPKNETSLAVCERSENPHLNPLPEGEADSLCLDGERANLQHQSASIETVRNFSTALEMTKGTARQL
jgi:hypothetical protein